MYIQYTHIHIHHECVFFSVNHWFSVRMSIIIKNQVTQGLRSENSLITAHPLAVRCRFIGMILKFL